MERNGMPQSYLCILHHLEAAKIPQTYQDLILATGFSHSTIRRAVIRLKKEGVVVEAVNLRDTRKTWYVFKKS